MRGINKQINKGKKTYFIQTQLFKHHFFIIILKDFIIFIVMGFDFFILWLFHLFSFVAYSLFLFTTKVNEFEQ